MKNRLTTITFAAILFAAVLMSLSCKDASQQNNTTGNTTANNTAMNANQSNSDKNSESVSALGYDCDGDIEARRGKIKRKMEAEIGESDTLQRQYNNGKFKFESVADGTGNLVLYVWGRVSVKNDDHIEKLTNAFRKFVKRGCVSKVVFDKPQTDRTTVMAGFEYALCEEPNQVCPNGICARDCAGGGNSNTNVINTNANALNKNTDANKGN